MKHINYRTYNSNDFKALSSIINITWKHEKSYSNKTAIRLSNAHLKLCLAEQTFTQVALVDENPVGVIMGNDLRNLHYPLKSHLQSLWAILVLSLTKEGRRAWHFFEEVDHIYENLLSSQPQKYDGELSFLAIHPNYRGLGIGKELYNRFYQYMQKINIQHFYVFTDTTCNYVFYEKQNMIRCGTENAKIKVNNTLESFLFFIYKNNTY